jgi:anti-anti-sigma factor
MVPDQERNRLHEQALNLCFSDQPMSLFDARLRRDLLHSEPGAFRRRMQSRAHGRIGENLSDQPFISVALSSGVPVLQVIGELDFFTAPQLEDLSRSITQKGHNLMVIDLSRASFVDAAAVSVMIRLNNAVRSMSGRLAVYDAKLPLRKVFELLHVDRIIPIRPTLEEALRQVLR